MRTIHRDIVGGFIFSADGKILLGNSRPGGVYEDAFVVPGGGVDEGETKEQALRREMLEETGLDTNNAKVKTINESQGESDKTLRDSGERVHVNMDFYDYRIDFAEPADQLNVKAEDDWLNPRWFTIDELKNITLGPPTRNTLVKTGIISAQ